MYGMGLATDSAKNVYAAAGQEYYSSTDLLLPNGATYHSVPSGEADFSIYITKLRFDGEYLPAICLLGEYRQNGECVSCGPHTTTANTGSQSVSDCMCSAGYFGSNGACTICPIGNYCPPASANATSCGSNTFTDTNGSSTVTQCRCNAGYFGTNGTCIVCPPGSYCLAGGSTSTSCGSNTFTVSNGSTSQSQCLCNAGYYGTNGACTACTSGNYCLAGSTSATSCGSNTYTESTGASAQSQCLCNAGFYGSNGACTICPPGSFCGAGIAAYLPTMLNVLQEAIRQRHVDRIPTPRPTVQHRSRSVAVTPVILDQAVAASSVRREVFVPLPARRQLSVDQTRSRL
jgi:hypothetical protein